MVENKKSQVAFLVLAAGQGKRMHSSDPKVLSPAAGEPMLFHILRRILVVDPRAPIAIVVGHQREKVEARVREGFPDASIEFAHQTEQLGTGDAARAAMGSPWGEAQVRAKRNVLVLPGDQPTISEALVRQMSEGLSRGAAMRLLTCTVAQPHGYGRIVRKGKSGPVLKIVEEKDASLREKEIREVATSIYLFDAAFLKAGLRRLTNKNAQAEYYLTDLVQQCAGAKKKIEVLHWAEPSDVRGVNTPWELAEASRILYARCARDWALRGVRFIQPETTLIDARVELEPEVVIYPGVLLEGATKVGRGAVIGPHCQIRDSIIESGAELRAGCVFERAHVGAEAKIGPYAHLRPESRVGARAKIGNFVELKKTSIGEEASIAHLSYLGDAEVGARSNIGCGFVTCNFDGRVIAGERKHKTVIEEDVFMGSDCQTVAPVRVGRGAYVASGSTITSDVEPEALAIARARQVNKPGYARKLKPGKGDQ
jgi:bifunctional UDP-N-acetylglucosamine pyrophosphorylase/glucosamine-1-phosphate N-acetyltransferase